MEHSLVVLVAISFMFRPIVVAGCRSNVIMHVSLFLGMPVQVNRIDRRVNGWAVLLVDFVRVPPRGASRAGPHKRGSQDGRKKLTQEGHLVLGRTTRNHCRDIL